MAVPSNPSELAAAAKCYCYDKETAQKVKLYLLAVIAGLDALTPEQLAALAKCYCLDPVTAAKVELYLECLIANAGTATCQMLTGDGDPTGVTTPEFTGQLYHDTTGDTWWYSTGTTSADWTEITGGAPAVCENVEGAGDPT